jgi:succinyl-CoA synthetase beta subunit
VESYKLIKHGGYYDVDLLKTVELFMNTDFNYHRENNTTPGRQIRKRIKLSKEVSKSLFSVVNNLYQKYAQKGTEAIIIKTFVQVEQSQFRAGDRVPLLPENMTQKLEL